MVISTKTKPAVCVPKPALRVLYHVFKLPPLEKVAAGIPAAFPKPFNVVPPDKNIEPSVKIAAVTGAAVHSSVSYISGCVSSCINSVCVCC